MATKRATRGGETSRTRKSHAETSSVATLPPIRARVRITEGDGFDERRFIAVVVQEHNLPPDSPLRVVTATHHRDGSPIVDGSSDSDHQEEDDDDYNPGQDVDHYLQVIRAQNAAIQENDSIILQLQQQLKEKAATSARQHSEYRGAKDEKDLCAFLDRKRTCTQTYDEGSSNSRSHSKKKLETVQARGQSKKQEVVLRNRDDTHDWIDRRINQAIQCNLKVADLTQDQRAIYDSVRISGSPFTQEIKSFPMPKKFIVPRFVLYDGTSDLAAHLRHFSQKMSIWGDEDHLYCRVFSSGLGDLPLRWFCALPEKSISSWQELQHSFMKKFEAHRVFPKTDSDLMALKMKSGDNITKFAKRFCTTYSQIARDF